MTRIHSRKGTPPARPTPERRTAPDRVGLPPGRVSSRSGAIRCREVRECSTNHSAIQRGTWREISGRMWCRETANLTKTVDGSKMSASFDPCVSVNGLRIRRRARSTANCTLRIFNVIECWLAPSQKPWLNFVAVSVPRRTLSFRSETSTIWCDSDRVLATRSTDAGGSPELLLNRYGHRAILSLVKLISLVRKCWMVFSMHLLVPSCCRVVDRQSTPFCLLLLVYLSFLLSFLLLFSFFRSLSLRQVNFLISCLTVFCDFWY